MQEILQDLRYAVRQFARRPGTTLAIVFVLTIGMTVAASLFSFIRSYTTAPAPGIERADDLVWVRGLVSSRYGAYGRKFPREEVRAHAAARETFRGVAGFTQAVVGIERSGAEQSDWIEATFVTDGFFELLAVSPAVGRGLAASPEDPLEAVISHGLSERHFATREAALGGTLMVSGRPVRVVGVAPADFRGVDSGEYYGLWLHESALPFLVAAEKPPLFGAFGRLAPGVTLATASAAVQAIGVHAAAQEVTLEEGEVLSTDVVPMAAMRNDPNFEREVVNMMTALTLLGVLVLVVTGMNASALQTGIAMTRGREVATRLSLGASRLRVVRQMLVESGLLGVCAGAAALGLLSAVAYVLPGLTTQLPFPLGIDATATAFTVAVALAAGVLAGMSPALYATRGRIVGGLKAGGGAGATRRNTLQRGLVFTQVLLTQPLVVMLVAMTLLILDEQRQLQGSEHAHEVASLQLLPASVDAAGLDRVAETERLAQRLEEVPGVVRAVPDPGVRFDVAGYTAPTRGPAAPFVLDVQFVAPGWFETLGQAMTAGRAFVPTDVPKDETQERPVVIGEALAAALWPGESPLGKRLAPPPDSQHVPLLVVGVTRVPGPEHRAGQPYPVYLPAPPDAGRIALLVRMRGNTTVVLGEIRRAVRAAAPGLGISELRTLGEIEAEARDALMTATSIFSGFGLLALSICAIGLYAVVAFVVSQRVGEIAVRLAIGARAGQVVRRTMRDGLKLVVIASAIGLPVSLAGLGFVTTTTNMLPPVPLWHVGTLAILAIATISALATWIPARAAARVEPAHHLRGD